MRTWPLSLVFVIFLSPQAWADQCDSVFEQAQNLLETAHTAYQREDYELAERWYTEAASCYDEVSRMAGCHSPEITEKAASSAALAKSNAELSHRDLEQAREKKRLKEERKAKLKKKRESSGQYVPNGPNLILPEVTDVPAPLRFNATDISRYWDVISRAGSVNRDSVDNQPSKNEPTKDR